MMDCQVEKNKEICPCSYPNCSRKGLCCECLKHHLVKRQLPGCCFSTEAEKTYDRSFEKFADLARKKLV